MEAKHIHVSATFQSLTFIISFLILLVILFVRYGQFITHDPVIPLIDNPSSMKKVTVGFHIAHFNTFNIAKNIFTLDGIVWFACDPKLIDIDILKKFSIHNGEILSISDPLIANVQGSRVVQFQVRASFQTPLDYRMFPLDDHLIQLDITNAFLPKDIAFESKPENITFDKDLYVSGWSIIDHTVKTGYREIALIDDFQDANDLRQETVIILSYKRIDPSIIINIFLTLMLILFISVLTFSSTEDSVLIVTVGIVALIGYRAVIQNMSPEQVSYFIFSDYMYLLALVGTILTLFGSIVTREKNCDRTFQRTCIIGVYALFIGGCALLAWLG